MIDSRKLEDLDPLVQVMAKQLLEVAVENGIKLILTSTYRDHEKQQALYDQGRTTPGKIVTNAKPGQSFHNWRVAFDVVPVENGKAIWDNNELWSKVGALGRDMGLEWGGDWTSFKDKPHFQLTGGLSLEDFQAGRQLSDVIELKQDPEEMLS